MQMRVADLFSGAGGFSEGARQAGAQVVFAANHWAQAVDYHRKNHPDAMHLCQDLHQCDWEQVPEHDVLLASPSCQGFSLARGSDKPRHDSARSTAWAVVSCVEHHRPEFVIVENVQQFQKWTLYPAWELAMNALGYAISSYVVDAADYGVPQHRVRLFLLCSRSNAPLMIATPKRSHTPAWIDWGHQGGWSAVDKPGRSQNTLARIAAGRKQFGDRFLVPYYSGAKTGRSLSRPLGTVTTKDRYALVDGDRMRMLTALEYRVAMGFPDGYLLPGDHQLAVHMLGNAVVPAVAKEFVQAVMAA